MLKHIQETDSMLSPVGSGIKWRERHMKILNSKFTWIRFSIGGQPVPISYDHTLFYLEGEEPPGDFVILCDDI